MTYRIGFIGQGWIGKSYADDFEARGYDCVRYALEAPYNENKDQIAECDIVFIAVPTPTDRDGFDASILRSALPLVGEGKIAVIKSTVLPGITEMLQKEFPNIIVLHSPEFLREAHAAHDAAHPERTIIGITEENDLHRGAADAVLSVLPSSSYVAVVPVRAAELIKCAGNAFLAMKVVFANILYDMAHVFEVPYEPIREAVGADPRIGPSHLSPVNASGHSTKPGRGAGGHCFIKDVEALRRLIHEKGHDPFGAEFFDALVRKNNQLLTSSGKDLELLHMVYRDKIQELP